jgi:hypothetical protein
VNLKRQILKEHSKANSDRITAYVGNDKKRFADLIKVYRDGPYRVTQRAAWPISCCVEKYPELIRPHLAIMLNFLRQPGLHIAVKRNTVRLLQFINIPKKFQGRVAEICFNFLHDKKEAVGVKAFSLTVLHNLSRSEPYMMNELKTIVEDQLPYAPASFRSRAKRILNPKHQIFLDF